MLIIGRISLLSALTLINSASFKTREKGYGRLKLEAVFSSRVTVIAGRCANKAETCPVPHGAVRKEGITGIDAQNRQC